MKKVSSCFVITTLLLSFIFTVPSQAENWITTDFLASYIVKSGGAHYDSKSNSLGSNSYWDEQIEGNQWVGKTRPEPLMGDANIDG